MTRSKRPVDRRRRAKLAAWILLSFACLGARAETTADKLETAQQLVDAMEYRAMFDSGQALCRAPGNALYDPAVLLENNPNYFRGITTRSAYWPEIQGVYRRNQLRACDYLSAEDFSRFMARQFAERISLDDLRTALAFYATPAGRRLNRAAIDVNSALQVYTSEAMRKAALEADKESQQEMIAIIKRYLQEPR